MYAQKGIPKIKTARRASMSTSALIRSFMDLVMLMLTVSILMVDSSASADQGSFKVGKPVSKLTNVKGISNRPLKVDWKSVKLVCALLLKPVFIATCQIMEAG